MNKSKAKLLDVRNCGGKETVIKGMVNHYKAVVGMKSVLKIEPPRDHVAKSQKKKISIIFDNLGYNDEYINVRHTYKGVAKIKKIIDNQQPQTFHLAKKLNHTKQIEIYEDLEHIRRLNAMSKRILAIGKVCNRFKKNHERKKNIDDPVSNPVYFFRKAGDEKATKLLSLDNYKEKLEEINKEERNKMLLNEVVYNSLNQGGGKKTINLERPSSTQTQPNFKKENKESVSIAIDAEKLIRKYMTMKKEEPSKVLTNNSKDKTSKTLEKRSKSAKQVAPRKEKLIPLPVVDKSKPKFKDAYQIEIVRYIVQNRIYKDSDLNILLDNLIKRNKGLLEKEEVIEILERIKKELDS